MVGGRPEEKGDERTRRWWEEGVGGGDDAEGKEASLDALVGVREEGWCHNAPALMLKQRRAPVLRARALPTPVTSDSIVWDPGLGREQNEACVSFQAHFDFDC